MGLVQAVRGMELLALGKVSGGRCSIACSSVGMAGKAFAPADFLGGEIFAAIGALSSWMPTSGHNPLTCNGQTESSPGVVDSGTLPRAACLRHRPGLTPNRFLKQVLNSPK